MVGGGGRRPRCVGSSLKVGREVGETWAGMGAEAGMGGEGKKKFPKKENQPGLRKGVKKVQLVECFPLAMNFKMLRNIS